MEEKQTSTLSILGRELGQFLLVGALGFALMRLIQHYWQNALAMLIGTTLIFALMLLVKRDLAITVAALILGVAAPLAEMRAVSAGALSYATPQLEGLPAWMFLVWGSVGVLTGSLVTFIKALIVQAQRLRHDEPPAPPDHG